MLCRRFVSFISSLENSSKICIRLLIFQEIPVEEEWRIPFLNELISAKNNKIVINEIDQA